jgi:hypothetical protein
MPGDGREDEGCAMQELEEALDGQGQAGDVEEVAARFADVAAAEQLLRELLERGQLGGPSQAAAADGVGDGGGGGFEYEGKNGADEQGQGGRRSVGGAAAIDAYLSGQW